ncbi:hypothetical protein MMC24_005186 [Lignoscripta atroalba]|nr:hypothetical protein [Lignoscripta atroalba]
MPVPYLPPEVLNNIFETLSDDKIFPFDNGGKKDLGNLRLVSHQFNAAAAPLLFRYLTVEAMELDEIKRFGDHGGALLLSYTKSIQVLRPSRNSEIQSLFLRRTINKLLPELKYMRRKEIVRIRYKFLDLFEGPRDNSTGHRRKIHDLLPPAGTAFSEMWDKVGHYLRGLKHVDVTGSTSYQKHLLNASQAFFQATGFSVEKLLNRPQAHWQTLQPECFQPGLMCCLTIRSPSLRCNGTTPSASIGTLGGESGLRNNLGDRLVSLDITMNLPSDAGNMHHVQFWVFVLSQLKKLQTLRLTLSATWEYLHMCPSNASSKLCLSRMLSRRGREPSQEDAWLGSNHAYMPQLKSVSFCNWAVDYYALYWFLDDHKDTLKEISFERMTLAALPWEQLGAKWEDLADSCKTVFETERVSFSKLTTHMKLDSIYQTVPAVTTRVQVCWLGKSHLVKLHRLAQFGMSCQTASESIIESFEEDCTGDLQFPAGAYGWVPPNAFVSRGGGFEREVPR